MSKLKVYLISMTKEVGNLNMFRPLLLRHCLDTDFVAISHTGALKFIGSFPDED